MSAFTKVIQQFSQQTKQRDSFVQRRDAYLAKANARLNQCFRSLDENERFETLNYHKFKCRKEGLEQMIENIQREMEDRIRRGDF